MPEDPKGKQKPLLTTPTPDLPSIDLTGLEMPDVPTAPSPGQSIPQTTSQRDYSGVTRQLIQSGLSYPDIEEAVGALRGGMGEEDFEDLLKGFVAKEVEKEIKVKEASKAYEDSTSPEQKRMEQRLRTPNRTVQWEYDETVGTVKGKRTQRRTGTSTNYDPNTNDLYPEGVMSPAIPDGASIISDDIDQGPQVDNRFLSLIEEKKERRTRDLLNSIRAGSNLHPLRYTGTDVRAEEKEARAQEKGFKIFRDQMLDAATMVESTLPGVLPITKLYDATVGLPDRMFTDPVDTILNPRTAKEWAASLTLDVGLALATMGTSLGAQASAAAVRTIGGRLFSAIAGRGLLGQAVKKGLPKLGTGIIEGMARFTPTALSLTSKYRLGFKGAETLLGHAPLTDKQSVDFLRKNFPDINTSVMTKQEIRQSANAINDIANKQEVSKFLNDSIPTETASYFLQGILEATPSMIGMQDAPVTTSRPIEIMTELAPSLIKATRMRDDGYNSTATLLNDIGRTEVAHIKSWETDIDRDFGNYLAQGAGSMFAILSPFRKMVAAAGFAPLNTLTAAKNLGYLAQTPFKKAAREAAPKAITELGRWFGGVGKNAVFSQYAGLVTQGAKTYNDGSRMYDLMRKENYSPGEAFVASYLIPQMSAGFEFFSEANLLPELTYNFGRGIFARMGKQLLIRGNPWEYGEEVLNRVMVYGAESIAGIDDDYRQQVDAPFPLSVTSRALRESLGDLIMTTIAGVGTSLKTFGRTRDKVGRYNVKAEKKRMWAEQGADLRIINSKDAHKRGMVITADWMEDQLVNEKGSPLRGKREEVEKLSTQDLLAEYYSFKYNLGAEEKSVFKKMVAHNIYGVTSGDLADMLKGDGKKSGMQTLADAFKLSESELSEFVGGVEKAYQEGPMRPWVITEDQVRSAITPNEFSTEDPGYVAEKARRAGEEPPMPTEAPPETQTEASIPVMITNRMKADLKAQGKTDAEISAMTPQEAQDVLKPVEAPSTPPLADKTLKELKTMAAENGIEVKGDKRKKKTYIDALSKKETENVPYSEEIDDELNHVADNADDRDYQLAREPLDELGTELASEAKESVAATIKEDYERELKSAKMLVSNLSTSFRLAKEQLSLSTFFEKKRKKIFERNPDGSLKRNWQEIKPDEIPDNLGPIGIPLSEKFSEKYFPSAKNVYNQIEFADELDESAVSLTIEKKPNNEYVLSTLYLGTKASLETQAEKNEAFNMLVFGLSALEKNSDPALSVSESKARVSATKTKLSKAKETFARREKSLAKEMQHGEATQKEIKKIDEAADEFGRKIRTIENTPNDEVHSFQAILDLLHKYKYYLSNADTEFDLYEYNLSNKVLTAWKKATGFTYDPKTLLAKGLGFFHTVDKFSRSYNEENLRSFFNALDEGKNPALSTMVVDYEGFGGKEGESSSNVHFAFYPNKREILWITKRDAYSGNFPDPKVPALKNLENMFLAEEKVYTPRNYHEAGVVATTDNFAVMNTDAIEDPELRKRAQAHNEAFLAKRPDMAYQHAKNVINSTKITDNQSLAAEIIAELRRIFPWVNVSNISGETDSKGNQILGYADYQAMIAAIDFAKGNLDTIPHEFAHFYVRLLAGNPLIQKGIAAKGSEEALVQAIGDAYLNIRTEGTFEAWVKDFWNLVKKVFGHGDVVRSLTRSMLNGSVPGAMGKKITERVEMFSEPEIAFQKVTPAVSPQQKSTPGRSLIMRLKQPKIGASDDEIEQLLASAVAEVRSDPSRLRSVIMGLQTAFAPDVKGKEKLEALTEIYKTLHRGMQKVTMKRLLPSLDVSNKNQQVIIGEEVSEAYPPLADVVGGAEAMMSKFRLQSNEAETPFAVVDNERIERMLKVLDWEGEPKLLTSFGKLTNYAKEFALVINEFAKEGYYYLGPAGKNDTHLFMSLVPESLMNGDVITALRNMLVASGNASQAKTIITSIEQAIQRQDVSQIEPFHLMLMAQAVYGEWLVGDKWATNPHRFYKYANTYATGEPYGEEGLVRDFIASPNDWDEFISLSGDRQLREAFEQMFEQEENGEFTLRTLAPDPGTLSQIASNDGYTLTPAGIGVKLDDDGKVEDLRIYTVLVDHPWYVDSKGNYYTSPGKGRKEVGDGGSLQSFGAGAIVDMAHGHFTGRVKIEKSRTLLPVGTEGGMLFKGQYEPAHNRAKDVMLKHGIGRITFATTIKQGKEDRMSIADVLSGNIKPEAVMRLKLGSITQAGSGALTHSLTKQASFASQTFLGNNLNLLSFPGAKAAIDAVKTIFSTRSHSAATMLERLNNDPELRTVLTRMASSAEEEGSFPLNVRDSVEHLSNELQALSLLPQFTVLTQAYAQKLVLKSLFDPSSGSLRTIGAGMFLKADWGLLDASNIINVLNALSPARGHVRDTLMKYFDLDMVLSRNELTDAPEPTEGQKVDVKDPRVLYAKAVDQEVKKIAKERTPDDGNVTSTEARIRSNKEEFSEVLDLALERLAVAQHFTPVKYKGNVYYLRGRGFLRPTVDGVVPILVSRNVANHAGWTLGKKIILTAIPTDAPHSTKASVIIGFTDSDNTISWSPVHTNAIGKDHDGDELHGFGSSEGYWAEKLSKKTLTRDQRVLYGLFHENSYMQLAEAEFNEIFDHFAKPETQEYVEKLYAKIGLEDAFEKRNGRSMGAKFLLNNRVVKAAQTDKRDLSTVGGQAGIAADYVGSLAGRIGAVAVTRLKIEYLLQHMMTMSFEDGTPMISNEPIEVRRVDGKKIMMKPSDFIALVNSILTHQSVDAPNQPDALEYGYSSSSHVNWALNALTGMLEKGNMVKKNEVEKVHEDLLRQFDAVRYALKGISSRGGKYSLLERLGLLYQHFKHATPNAIFDHLSAGFGTALRTSPIDMAVYRREAALEIESAMTFELFGFPSMANSRVLNKGMNRARIIVSKSDRDESLVGNLKYHVQHKDSPEHAAAVLAADTIAQISILRWMQRYINTTESATALFRDAARLSDTRSAPVIKKIAAIWVNNLARTAYERSHIDILETTSSGKNITLSRAGLFIDGESLTPEMIMSIPDGSINRVINLMRTLGDVSTQLGGSFIMSTTQMNELIHESFDMAQNVLAESPDKNKYDTMMRLFMISELPLRIETKGNDYQNNLDVLVARPADSTSAQSDFGGIYARKSELLGSSSQTARVENGKYVTSRTGELTSHNAWEFMTPELFESLGKAAVNTEEYQRLMHNVDVPRHPREHSQVDEDSARSIDKSSEVAARLLKDEAELAQMIAAYEAMKDETPVKSGLANLIKQTVARIKDLKEMIAAGLVIGGAVALAFSQGDVSNLSEIMSAGTSLALAMASPMGPSPARVRSWQKSASSTINDIRGRLRRKFPRLHAGIVNGIQSAYDGVEMFITAHGYEQVGMMSGKWSIFHPNGLLDKPDQKEQFIVTATNLAHLATFAAVQHLNATAEKNWHVVNDIFLPLVRDRSNMISIARGKLEQVGLRLKGLEFDEVHHTRKLATVGWLSEEEQKDLSKDEIAFRNEMRSQQLLQEELHTGSVFGIKMFLIDGKWKIENEKLEYGSIGFKRAVARYGSEKQARAMHQAVVSLKQYYTANIHNMLSESQHMYESAMSKTSDVSKRNAYSSIIGKLSDTLYKLRTGENAFPISFAGFVEGSTEHAADHFTELFIDSYLRNDRHLRAARGTGTFQQMKRLLALEAMMTFFNKGGKLESEKDLFASLIYANPSKPTKEELEFRRLLGQAVSRKTKIEEYDAKIEALRVHIEHVIKKNPALTSTEKQQYEKQANDLISNYEKESNVALSHNEAGREGLLNARQLLLTQEALIQRVAARASTQMRISFRQSEKVAPADVELSGWDPVKSARFIDFEALADTDRDDLGIRQKPLSDYFGNDAIRSSYANLEYALRNLLRQEIILMRDWAIERIEGNGMTSDAQKSVRTMEKWITGNFGYNIYAQPVELDKLLKREHVAIDVIWNDEDVVYKDKNGKTVRKKGKERKKVLYATYEGKKGSIYTFHYHTPGGEAVATWDPENRRLAGVGVNNPLMSVDLNKNLNTRVNPSARIEGLRLRMEDNLSDSFNSTFTVRTAARLFEKTAGAFGSDLDGQWYIEKVTPWFRFMWGIANIGTGVMFLGVNPTSAIRNFVYPFKQNLIGNLTFFQTEGALKQLASQGDPHVMQAYQILLDSLPTEMFDYLARGLGEGGEQVADIIGAGKEPFNRVRRALRGLAEFNKIYGEATLEVDKMRDLDPIQRQTLLKQLAVQKANERALKGKMHAKATLQSGMGWAYLMFSKIEMLNRKTAMVTALINTGSGLLQQTHEFGTMEFEGKKVDIDAGFQNLPPSLQREALSLISLRARREDERVNYDYAQLMRPAYLRKAYGQVFFKFATFTQASYIWRKRDYQAGRRDYRLLKEGKMTFDGKTLGMGEVLKQTFTKKGTAFAVDLSMEVNPSYFTPEHWRTLIDYYYNEIGDMDDAVDDTPVTRAKKVRRKKAFEKKVIDLIKKSTEEKGGHVINLHRARINELTRGLRMMAFAALEWPMYFGLGFQTGILREPINEAAIYFIEILMRSIGAMGPGDDDELIYDTNGKLIYDMKNNAMYVRRRKEETLALWRSINFVFPLGGIVSSNVITGIGERFLDPDKIISGQVSWLDRFVNMVFGIRGLTNMKYLIESMFSDDRSVTQKGAQLLLSATELNVSNRAQKKREDLAEKLRKEVQYGRVNNARDYAEAIARRAMKYVDAVKGEEYEGKEWSDQKAMYVRLEKARMAMAGVQAGEDLKTWNDGKLTNAVNNLITFYRDIVADIFLAPNKDTVKRAKFFLPDAYDDVEGKYSYMTLPEFKASDKWAKITVLAEELALKGVEDWIKTRKAMK